jgi:glucosamine 6-phosphate synthetase-like amidotransferase/phosphosugar isomerase protein
MCGVWGFVSKDGAPPDLRTLRAVAADTERRGRHAWGMAWCDGKGRLRMFKAPGPVSDMLGVLRMAADARWLIGHCRFATHGSPADNSNNHPHPADGGWLVHNGLIPAHEGILARLGVRPTTDCDTEALCALVESRPGPVLGRCRRAARASGVRPLALLALWTRPVRLVLVRRNGQPLHAGGAAEGTYVASLPDALPGQVREFPDDTAFLATPRGVTHVPA